MGAGGRFVPLAGVHGHRLVGDVAGQHDNQADDHFHYRTGVGIGCIENGDALLRAGLEVNLIGADAESGDGHQLVGGFDGLGREIGLRAQAEDMDALQRLDQVVFVKRALDGRNVVTFLAEGTHGVRMDVFQQQHFQLGTREGIAALITLGVQHFVERGGGQAGIAIDGGDHLRAHNILCEGIEALGGTALVDLEIGPAVTDHGDRAGDAEAGQGHDLAAILRQRVGLIDTNGHAVFVPDQAVGQHVFGLDAVVGDHRIDEIMETAGDDQKLAGILGKDRLVADYRGADLGFQHLDQGGDIVARRLQKLDAAAEGFGEADLAGHGLIGQGLDLGDIGMAGGISGGQQFGQNIERLDRGEGRIEIENDGGQVRLRKACIHSGHAHLRAETGHRAHRPYRKDAPQIG